ncbi:MAG: hypothetical protein C5B51_17315 [Terriglobia bacterium]|nr:MAG: hypothetical protein C5B51_17315 [Terriglobia bacterium]
MQRNRRAATRAKCKRGVSRTVRSRKGPAHIRFHDTRHCCGTLLNAQGASSFTIQRVLGHSQLEHR